MKNHNKNFTGLHLLELFEAFDVRSEEKGISAHFPTFLFLLNLYREAYIDESSFGPVRSFDDFWSDQIEKVLEKDGSPKARAWSDLSTLGIEDYIKERELLIALILHFKKLKVREVDSNQFFQACEEFVYQFSESFKTEDNASFYIQPFEFNELVIGLGALVDGASIYNPFAGMGSLGIYSGRKYRYYGHENHLSHIIDLVFFRFLSMGMPVLEYSEAESNMLVSFGLYGFDKDIRYKDDSKRIVLQGENGNIVEYSRGKAVKNWNPKNEKYDLIVATPFSDYRNINRWFDIFYKSSDHKIRTLEDFVLLKGMKTLKDNGVLTVMVKSDFLGISSKSYEAKKYIVDNDFLDSVIYLPSAAIGEPDSQLVLLVLRKKSKNAGYVRFIDGKKTQKEVNQQVVLNVPYLLEAEKGAGDTSGVLNVNTREIKRFEYALRKDRYTDIQYEGATLTRVVTEIKGEQPLKGTAKGRILSGQDLIVKREGQLRILAEDLLLQNFNDKSWYTTNRLGNYKKIDESCLMFLVAGGKQYVSYFEYREEPVYLKDKFISTMAVDEDKVDVDYLVDELRSEGVFSQLKTMLNIEPSGMLKVPVEAIKAVVIPLPSIEAQQEKVRGIKQVSLKIRELENLRGDLIRGAAIQSFNEFASLKHTLGRPRQNILDWVDNLLHFFSDQGEDFNQLDQKFQAFYEVGIKKVLREIIDDIDFISEVLERGEKGLVLENYPLTIEPLSKINEWVKKIKKGHLPFVLSKQLLSLSKEELLNEGIICNETLFIALIDNLLSNAAKHGFEDIKKKGNSVEIKLSVSEKGLVLEVRNSGNPFPSGFDKEKFITKFSTADKQRGSGLGGYDVHRIAVYMEASDWELLLGKDSVYTVWFRFVFPIKPV